MNRRKFLASVGVSGVMSVTAGCLSGSKEYKGDYGHPAANNISDQPRIGPKPSESDAVIIAFEDPACPICKSFHNGAYQELKNKYIESGELTFIYRGIDVVYDWGEVPLKIQEKVYDEVGSKRSMELIEKYYDEQDSISSENIMEKSNEILNSIGLDKELTSGLNKYGSNLRDDIQASEKSGVRGTPTFYLFSNKKYETEIVGSKSTSVYTSVFEL